MFSIDLDEIDMICKENLFISKNRFNLFSFRDKDHIQLEGIHTNESNDLKEHVLTYVERQGMRREEIQRIQLITNLCTLGYQFNPVSFYFCYNGMGDAVCSIVEVCNTFGEMKLYFLGKEVFSEDNFSTKHTKNFYVSPFIDMDTDFDFKLFIPNEVLKIRINDYQKGRKFFLSTLIGERKSLTNWNVLSYAVQFPLITLQIITLIHWQAIKLWFKKLRYHKKTSFIELQKDVLKPHKSLTN